MIKVTRMFLCVGLTIGLGIEVTHADITTLFSDNFNSYSYHYNLDNSDSWTQVNPFGVDSSNPPYVQERDRTNYDGGLGYIELNGRASGYVTALYDDQDIGTDNVFRVKIDIIGLIRENDAYYRGPVFNADMAGTSWYKLQIREAYDETWVTDPSHLLCRLAKYVNPVNKDDATFIGDSNHAGCWVELEVGNVLNPEDWSRKVTCTVRSTAAGTFSVLVSNSDGEWDAFTFTDSHSPLSGGYVGISGYGWDSSCYDNFEVDVPGAPLQPVLTTPFSDNFNSYSSHYNLGGSDFWTQVNPLGIDSNYPPYVQTRDRSEYDNGLGYIEANGRVSDYVIALYDDQEIDVNNEFKVDIDIIGLIRDSDSAYYRGPVFNANRTGTSWYQLQIREAADTDTWVNNASNLLCRLAKYVTPSNRNDATFIGDSNHAGWIELNVGNVLNPEDWSKKVLCTVRSTAVGQFSVLIRNSNGESDKHYFVDLSSPLSGGFIGFAGNGWDSSSYDNFEVSPNPELGTVVILQ